ncbi:STT3 domain-containing protein [Sulfurimonas diazotrophicus]|uniref:STT3 domain-containing protein n=1 Tax=Sulfurimonas diazotrophicus TaxID=3131939 RepID=A0ABZ3H9T1_9BACT
MINTNDGYYFASSAQQALEGMHADNPRVLGWMELALTFLTTVAVKFFPVDLNTVILYMPAVISSLVVIPMILIGRLYGQTLLGFFAALIGSIAWSYYNRTMIGYYDTDMFSAMAPMFILYFLMATIEKETYVNALMAAFTIALYRFLYDQGLSIIYAMGLIYMGYMVLFHRHQKFTYHSIILIAIALMPLQWWIKVPLLIAAHFVFKNESVSLRHLMVIAGITLVLFLINGNVFGVIWSKVSGYLFRGTEEVGLHFYQVSQTVREAGTIPFSVMADRISGSVPGVIAALIGYLLLVMRSRPFLLALPLIGIGVFSLWGGLRFTVYAVPVAALGAVYLFYVLASYIPNRKASWAAVALLTGLMLFPNIKHIIGYKVPTVFTKEEVALLDKMKAIGSERDYVITWWDYGYPIWYYSNMNTLIDGGKHSHDNYIVSRVLTTDSPKEAASLSRLAVETYVDSGYRVAADTLFRNKQPDQVDTEAYLEQLRVGEVTLPEPTRDIYLYLPLRMLDIFSTIKVFSNLDLQSGQSYKMPFYYVTGYAKQSGNLVDLGNGLRLDLQKSVLQAGRQSLPLRRFVITEEHENGPVGKQVNLLHFDGTLSVIFMRSANKFLVLDEEMYQSLFIQMGVLENYDADLYEPVILSPWAKIYRLKI